jgi:hypothetical protein
MICAGCGADFAIWTPILGREGMILDNRVEVSNDVNITSDPRPDRMGR